MSFSFNNEQPIYLQLMDIYKQKFVRGEMKSGDQLPSVRDAALEFGVNPNTVQKAFSELDREGYTRSERTAGRFVTLPEERRMQLQAEMAEETIRTFLEKMEALGLSRQDIHRWIGGEDEHADRV